LAGKSSNLLENIVACDSGEHFYYSPDRQTR